MNHPSRNARKKPKRVRIMLVDDHPMVRERLAEVINRQTDLSVCGEAEEREGAIALAEATRPHLAIIDLTLKNSDGLELIKDLHARWPALLMLVVSMHDESLYAERVIRAGALGYITKQEATRNILLAIRRVLAGSIYLTDRVAAQVISRVAGRCDAVGATPAERLASRERQVFELTGRGLNTRQIAGQLQLGVKTVETYRARIREKLQLKDPSELLKVAIAWAHAR